MPIPLNCLTPTPAPDVGSRINAILRATCAHYRMDPVLVASRNRTMHVSMVRQVAMYLCRDLLRAPYVRLGKQFDRDHSTVVHACQVVARRSREYPDFQRSVEKLRAQCQ